MQVIIDFINLKKEKIIEIIKEPERETLEKTNHK